MDLSSKTKNSAGSKRPGTSGDVRGEVNTKISFVQIRKP